MRPSLKIRPNDGAVTLGSDLVLVQGMDRARIEPLVSAFYKSATDMGNGYKWLMCHEAEFGGEACGFALCFLSDKLVEVHLGVSLPSIELIDGWPTKQAIDQEVNFTRREMQRQLGRTFASGHEKFKWGVVWSQFDPKGFQASAGVRYEV